MSTPMIQLLEGGPGNIARHIPAMAEKLPHQRAIVFPEGRDAAGRRAYTHLTFRQLDEMTNRVARGLEEIGITRGTRTVLMVKPSLEFIPLTFALFKVGAIPVLIDPGMGRDNLLKAIEEVEPEGFVGVSLAHAARTIFKSSFRSVKHVLTVGKRWWWGGATLEELLAKHDGAPYDLAATDASDTAAILFTTGSTGPPKGVVYTHGIFEAQTQIIRDVFGVSAGDIDLPVFPLFALFSTALGATVVVPDMDPTRPAEADPEKMIEAIEDQGVTYSFGSPAFWKQVGGYCASKGRQLKTLRRVFMAGAPVPPDLVDTMAKVLAEPGDVYIPYGATESLPVSWVSGTAIRSGCGARSRDGKGTCVGMPISPNDVRIIEIDDAPIASMDDSVAVETGTIGEITVRGPVVTSTYLNRPTDTEGAKIADGDAVRHRMGDVGYFDDDGRLWFCGRKAHRVRTAEGTLYTVPCEAIFNQHERVYRSALVGVGAVGAQTPVIIIECEQGRGPRDAGDRGALQAELQAMAKGHELTKTIETVLFHESFPVDIRHNAKIFREKLAVWAAKELSR